ncbi:DUF6683 family protein [Caulobacter sp. BK020]|uniref:DUF6683 family protein n=1 Tax=Caulobacter sp. BK020 TaxID=2512117 RepID=UPI0010530B12|nr:DUF6683 family protein [Caulobacter sp. BK020]TCS15913.1 hypothetical protein EV278_10487 [Caulobacter sp. BK020]
MKILGSIGLALLMALTGAVTSVHAQDMPTVLPNDYVLKDILNQQRVEAAIGARPGEASRRAPTPSQPRSTSITTVYRPAPAVSARVRRQFADWMGKQTSPEEGRRVAQLLERGDPVRDWAQLVGGDGLRPGDAADALAAYWILNWVIANNADSDRAQVLAVRQQVRAIMAGNPAFARLDDPGRQEFAETLMLNFLVQQAAYVDALKRGDWPTQKRLGDAAVARFRSEMGVDLRGLRLTAGGFVRA